MPTIPNGFTPTVAAYSSDAPAGVLRTDVAGGVPRYGLEWDRGTQRFNVTLVLDATQYSVWVAFYHHLIKKGAIAFDMRLDTGLGTALHSCHIVPDSYSATRTGGTVMVVAFVVETISAVYALSDVAVAAYGLSSTVMPAGLTPLVQGYALSDPGGVINSEVSGGVAAYALEYFRGPQRFACQLLLSPDQFATWSVWFHRLIAKGAYTFDMPLDSGFGVQTHAANIVPGSYSATRTGGIHTLVSFAVEAEPKAYDLSTAEAQSMVDLYNLYGTGTDELLAAIAQFALVDSLVLDW